VSSSGQVTFATNGFAASTSSIRAVVLAVSGGTLTAEVGNSVGVSARTTGASIALTGTEKALSDYLAQAGNLSFSGEAANYTLTVTAQSKDSGGAVIAANTLTSTVTAQTQVGYGASGTATTQTAPTLTLPSSFVAAPNTSAQLVFAANSLGTSTSNTRTVLLSVSGGTLTAVADSTVGLATSATGTSIALTGTEKALSDYLAQAGNLSFNGAAGTYALTATAQTRSGNTVVAATALTATITAQAQVTYGASTSLAATSWNNSIASVLLDVDVYGNDGGATRDDNSDRRSAGGGGGGAGGVGGTGGSDVTSAGNGGAGRIAS
jgi:hypothetical protein